MTACMQDGNTETVDVIVSIAFVPSEAKESTGHGFATTTSSKHCPWTGKQSHSYQTEGTGLVPALCEVFPENEHRHCVVHIGRNMVGRFKVKSLAVLVYNAAKKTTKEGCDRWLKEIKKGK